MRACWNQRVLVNPKLPLCARIKSTREGPATASGGKIARAYPMSRMRSVAVATREVASSHREGTSHQAAPRRRRCPRPQPRTRSAPPARRPTRNRGSPTGPLGTHARALRRGPPHEHDGRLLASERITGAEEAGAVVIAGEQLLWGRPGDRVARPIHEDRLRAGGVTALGKARAIEPPFDERAPLGP